MKESTLKELKTKLLDLLFPSKCPFCGKILREAETLVCASCQKELPWLVGEVAEKKVDFTKKCLSPLAYRQSVRNAIHRYKFSRVRACAVPFGTLMTQCVQDQGLTGLDGVTWAPLSPKRLRSRGFDQAELLAIEVGKQLELPVLSTLEKKRHTAPQSGMTQDAARRANALGAYALKTGRPLAGKRLLLVDDVVTSGATIGECARLLSQEGAEVFGLTLAQARPDGEKDRCRNRKETGDEAKIV